MSEIRGQTAVILRLENPKFQAPNPKESPNLNFQVAADDYAVLEFGLEICLVPEAWDLKFSRPFRSRLVEHFVRPRRRRLRRFDDKVIIVGQLGVDGDLR